MISAENNVLERRLERKRGREFVENDRTVSSDCLVRNATFRHAEPGTFLPRTKLENHFPPISEYTLIFARFCWS